MNNVDNEENKHFICNSKHGLQFPTSNCLNVIKLYLYTAKLQSSVVQ